MNTLKHKNENIDCEDDQLHIYNGDGYDEYNDNDDHDGIDDDNDDDDGVDDDDNYYVNDVDEDHDDDVDYDDDDNDDNVWYQCF